MASTLTGEVWLVGLTATTVLGLGDDITTLLLCGESPVVCDALESTSNTLLLACKDILDGLASTS